MRTVTVEEHCLTPELRAVLGAQIHPYYPVHRWPPALEARLGARLLNRTTRRLSLTEVGPGYYERARQILADLEEADRAASDLQAAPRGTLKVNAPYSFGIRHVAPAIAAYLAACPEGHRRRQP